MKDYTPNIVKILYAYAPGSPGLVGALNALCHTAEENGHKNAKDSLAQEACEGLHTGPAAGVKCMKCYQAEQGYAEEELLLAEIAAAQARKEEEKK